MAYILCQHKGCYNKARWLYMPSGPLIDSYCDKHVPRGCSCNTLYAEDLSEENITKPSFGKFDSVNYLKWKPFKYEAEPLDIFRREYPCCEWSYFKNGIDLPKYYRKITKAKNFEKELYSFLDNLIILENKIIKKSNDKIRLPLFTSKYFSKDLSPFDITLVISSFFADKYLTFSLMKKIQNLAKPFRIKFEITD